MKRQVLIKFLTENNCILLREGSVQKPFQWQVHRSAAPSGHPGDDGEKHLQAVRNTSM